MVRTGLTSLNCALAWIWTAMEHVTIYRDLILNYVTLKMKLVISSKKRKEKKKEQEGNGLKREVTEWKRKGREGWGGGFSKTLVSQTHWECQRCTRWLTRSSLLCHSPLNMGGS